MAKEEKLFEEIILKALPKIMFELQNELKKAAPVDTGRLRNSIKVTISGKDQLDIFMVEYWKYIEFGTNPHVIRPKSKEALRFESGKKQRLGTPGATPKNTFAKKVMHPGTRPFPFIRTTLFTKLPDIVRGALK